MTRVALACSEPIRSRMAGIGIRYAEMVRALARADFEVVLLTTGSLDEAASLGLPAHDVRQLRARGRTRWDDCAAIVVQGRASVPLLRSAGSRPVVVDLYDPWLVENLYYWASLGDRAYRRDMRAWRKQLRRGDLFLASCEQQRLYYLGMLTAIGRVDPQLLSADPDLEGLVTTVPFGLPAELPSHRRILKAEPSAKRILFGCLYDWLDPWPLLHALEAQDRGAWEVLFVATPNQASTPDAQLERVREWCVERGWWGSEVRLIEWVPAGRRFDLFRDVDALVVGHRQGLEARLGLRTRVLEAGAVGCPIVVNDGGATAELVRDYGLGAVAASTDAGEMLRAIDSSLGAKISQRQEAGRRLRRERCWDRAVEPLARFLHEQTRPGRTPSAQPHDRARAGRAVSEG